MCNTIAEEGETYVLARSRARAQKEGAMRSPVVRGLMRDLIKLRRLLRHGRLKDPDKLLLRVGALQERYPQARRYLKITVEALNLRWQWDRAALRLAQSRDGAYLLRTNLQESDPATLWRQYIQLTEVEAVFRALKSDLAIRPIWHFTARRIEGHILVAFLGYCLSSLPQTQTARRRAQPHPVATARPVWAHRAGGSLVQAARGRLPLPGADHPARAGASRAHRSTQLALATATSATDL